VEEERNGEGYYVLCVRGREEEMKGKGKGKGNGIGSRMWGEEKCVVCWKCERIRRECVFTKVPF